MATRPLPPHLFNELTRHPDDAEVREVIADWLEEHDDPRAELIRIQCQLERIDDDDARVPVLERRQNALLQRHHSDWSVDPRYQPVRGYSHVVDCRYLWGERLDAVCQSEPITKLINWPSNQSGSHRDQIQSLIYDDPDAALAFLQAEHWPPRLDELAMPFVANKILPLVETWERFQQLKRVAVQLRTWNLHQVFSRLTSSLSPQAMLWLRLAADTESVEALAPLPPGCQTRLELQGYWPTALAKLVESNPRVEQLKLVAVEGVDTTESEWLLAAPWTQSVRKLSLHLSTSSMQGARLLESIGFASQLHEFALHVSFTSLGKIGDWLASHDWGLLRRFRFSSPNLAMQQTQEESLPIQALLRLLQSKPPRLRRLDLASNVIPAAALRQILAATPTKTLTHLKLTDCALGDDAITHLLSDGPWDSLVALDLRGNPISNDAHAKLKAVFGPCLRRVPEDTCDMGSREFIGLPSPAI